MPAMLPNGDVVRATTTKELLEFTSGMNNRTICVVVTELSELKTSKNGLVYMHVFATNDDEEPLRINVWRKPATDKIMDGVKPGGLYKFEGLKLGPTKPQFQYGNLPYDIHWYEWGGLKLICTYVPKELPLKAAHEINPQSDWRIRCRGVVSQDFTRYMRYSSALTGMMRVREDLQFQVTLHSVPMAYWYSFTKSTEIEVVGHIKKNDDVWDLDVTQWADVRNSSSFVRNAASDTPPSIAKTPETPLTPSTENSFFANSTGTPPSSSASMKAAEPPATPTSTFVGVKVGVEGMLIQPPVWEVYNNCYVLVVSIAHHGKPKVVKVVTTQMLHALVEELVRGVKVLLNGTISQTRTGFTMDAHSVALASSIKKKALPTTLPSDFSTAEDINGATNDWHKIHVDIISEFAFDDQTGCYSGYVNVHDSAKGIFVHLKGVPDEAVPRLSLFEELHLIGPVSEGEDSLDMTVEWKNAAFDNAAEGSTITKNKSVLDSPAGLEEEERSTGSADSSLLEATTEREPDCIADKENKSGRKRPTKDPKKARKGSGNTKKAKGQHTTDKDGAEIVVLDSIVPPSSVANSEGTASTSAGVTATAKIKEEPSDEAFSNLPSTSIPARMRVSESPLKPE